ncbi:hypothetical protein [Embleya sp. MST-111070]|uniref:hypothetical protein n=1 Tax=Embleya sp. MST-111070 TaxID=3398231 RepID=UPI003F739758
MAFLRRDKSGDRMGDDGNPFTQRGFIAAAAGFGFLCVVALGVVVFEPDGPPSSGRAAEGATTSGPSVSSTTSAGGPAAPGGAGPADAVRRCPALSDQDQSIPTTRQPDGVVWEPYHGVGLPVSRAAGPALADSGTVRCYAHTPVGALIAAAQASERYETTESPTLAAGTMLAAGPGRESFLARARSAATSRAVAESPANEDKPQFVGFRVEGYSAQAATVTLVRMRERAATFDATTWTVVWDDGWRLQLPPDGSRPSARSVPSRAGYVAWTP